MGAWRPTGGAEARNPRNARKVKIPRDGWMDGMDGVGWDGMGWDGMDGWMHGVE